MTKKDIVRIISDKIDLPQFKVKDIVQMTFEAIGETLAQEGRIELRNFGVFEVRTRRAHKARNPKTGESVHSPETLTRTAPSPAATTENLLSLRKFGACLR